MILAVERDGSRTFPSFYMGGGGGGRGGARVKERAG